MSSKIPTLPNVLMRKKFKKEVKNSKKNEKISQDIGF